MKNKIKKGVENGVIICIHGNSSSSLVFESILNSDKIKQTVIAVDLPGHGENIEDYKNHQDFSMDFYREKLIHFIDAIDDDVLLVGNSLGGHLAIEIANEIENLKGLVIFSSPPVKKPINFEEAFLPVEALQTFFTEKPTDEAISSAVNIAVQNKECIATITSDFFKANPLVRASVAKDLLGNETLNEYEIFTKLEILKFIIAGDKDPSVNRDYLEKVAKNCDNNCEFILMENCGHYPSIEKPTEFIDVLNHITNKVF